MALKQVLIDDIDGKEGAKTRHFALGNNTYAADLTDENYAKLEKALAPFIKVARRRGAKPKVKTAGNPTKITQTQGRADMAAIRAWAMAKGLPVTDRGRIPRNIEQQFYEEHDGTQVPTFSG